MSNLDNIPDENDAEGNNFEKMLEESISRSCIFQIGEKVHGNIVHFNDEFIFVDISGKSEAIIDSSEFKDKKGTILVKNGDPIDAFVISTKGDEIKLTSKIGRGFSNPELLLTAFQNSIPVYGTPVRTHKGGYSVLISNIDCFCPYSQIDIKTQTDKESYLNKEYAFKVIEYEQGGKKIILSRKILLEGDKKDKIIGMKERLKIGDIVSGKIISLHAFGIFVKIEDTVEALVPKSEISWSRRNDNESFLPGQEINGRVLSIDWENEKITLSIKQLKVNPLDTIERFKAGDKFNGRVVNMIQSGAFIEIEPGIEGFLHISRMSRIKRVNTPRDIFSIGDMANVGINSIDMENKKISLELLTDEPDPWLLPLDKILDSLHKGTTEASMQNGINVRLDNGMTGFVPKKELLSGSSDIQKSYPVGREVSLTVIQIKKETRGLILSERGALSMQDRKEYEKYQDNNTSSASTTLGEQLKGRFLDIQKNLKSSE